MLRNNIELNVIDMESSHRSDKRMVFMGYFALKLDWQEEGKKELLT